MKSRIWNWVIVSIFLLIWGVAHIQAATTSFDETLQKKESSRKVTANENKSDAMTKEKWQSMSAEEKQKYHAQRMQAEAARGAQQDFLIIKKAYSENNLYPPADETILQLGTAKEKQAVSLLSEILLKYPVTDIKVAAAEALGNIGEPSAIPILIKALNDKDYQVKVATAVALVKLGKPDEAFPILAKVAKKEELEKWDLDVEERLKYVPKEQKEKHHEDLIKSYKYSSLPSEAIQCLGQIKTTAAQQVIEVALHDEDEIVRLNAAYILMATKKKTIAISTLEKILEDNNLNSSVRAAALGGLAKGKGIEEKNVIRKFIKDKDEYVSTQAAKLLQELEGAKK